MKIIISWQYELYYPWDFSSAEMAKTVVVNLSEIWDEKILRDDRMKKVIRIIRNIEDYEGSWLVSSINTDRMIQDNKLDRILMKKYGKCTRKDLYYYFPLMGCHIYSLFLGVFLSIKYPETEWRIVYFRDHYVVMKLEDIENENLVMYDIQASALIECGMEKKNSYWLDDRWFYERISVKTINEQLGMIIMDDYY